MTHKTHIHTHTTWIKLMLNQNKFVLLGEMSNEKVIKI